MKKPITVHFTKDLSKFNLHNVNREVKAPKVRRLKNLMNADGVKLVPIIVNKNFDVIDGQHRLVAARETGNGIYYLVDNSIPTSSKGIFDAARKFNQSMNEWSKKDYIHGFCVQGLEDYKTLDEFTKEFPMFSLTECIMLLQNSGTRHVAKDVFSDGRFKVVNLNIARKWANHLLQLKPYFEFGYNKSLFVRAFIDILSSRPEFDFESFLHKVQLRPGSIYLCGDKVSYRIMIENIYNYKRANDKKINLRF
jgi:hypothetical protein